MTDLISRDWKHCPDCDGFCYVDGHVCDNCGGFGQVPVDYTQKLDLSAGIGDGDV